MLGERVRCPNQNLRQSTIKTVKIFTKKASDMKNKILLAMITTISINLPLCAADVSGSAPAPKLTILEPQNGATVPATFTVKFGATGVDIVPVGGEHAEHNHDAHHDHAANPMGHFHLLTDADSLPSADKPMPANANLVHLMQGQTETTLTLSPGKHTLQLVLGDSSHMMGAAPVVSKKITIVVK